MLATPLSSPSCSSEDTLPDLTPEVNKKETMSKSEKCAVCGKPAFCYNYGVLTCNACKMFFRRVEVEKVTYTCKFWEKCYDEPSLSKCKSCRFKMCLLAGMKYIPPGKPLKNSEDDTINGIISNLLVLESRRRHKFLNFYTSEDPTLLEMLERPNRSNSSRMIMKTEEVKINPHEWSFLGIYTSIEFLLSLEFIDQLVIRDKTILIHNYAVKAMLFAGGQRTVDDKRDKVVTPDKKDVYPDSLYSLLSLEFLHRIRTSLVARLIELKVTREEYVLINVILFCNTALSNLSPEALSLISSHQKAYSNALLQYCLLTYQHSGPARFTDLLSLCHVINRNFEDVHYLTTLIQFYMPSLKLKKLYTDLMKHLE